MTLGFSYIGLIFILMLTIPNLFWTRHKPTNYTSEDENKILLAFERIGQVFVTAIAISFKEFNINTISPWTSLLLIAFLIMLLYEAWWIKYFKSQKKLSDFYSSYFGVPLAGATLPVFAFFILGVYGKNPLMLIAIVCLGIGHIGIHFEHSNKINEFENNKLH